MIVLQLKDTASVIIKTRGLEVGEMLEVMREAGMRRPVIGRRMVCVLGIGLLMAGASRAAGPHVPMGQQQTPTSSRTPPPIGVQTDSSDPFQARIEDKRIAFAETERHKRMLADADRLLQLATELKQDVDSTTKNEMSVPTIKKAAEIEKLAHDVKERMKGQ